MGMKKATLNGTYQEVGSGSATIQKRSKGFGAAFIYFGSAAPTDDTNSFLLDTEEACYFETQDKIFARTPHGGDVDIVLGS